MTDWNAVIKEAESASGSSGALFETNSGMPPGYRKVQEATGPGLLAGIRAGLSDDPEAKIRAYASSRFGDPAASERYGILNGEVVFADDSGQLRSEGGGLAAAGEALGSSPSFIGGTVGGILGGPLGAGLGGMAGEGYRRLASLFLNDEQQSPEGNMRAMNLEGLLNAGGWKLGEMFGGGIVDRRTASDIGRFDPAAANALTQKAADLGISLTGAESSGLRSLMGKQRVLQASHGEAGDVMGAFYEKRSEQQIPQAVDRFIGPQQDADIVGAKVRDAAIREIADLEAERAAVGSPMYRAASQDGDVVTENVVSMIDSMLEKYGNTGVGRELAKVRASLFKVAQDTASPPKGMKAMRPADELKRSVDQLHAVKLDIDTEIAKHLERPGSATLVRELEQVQKRLLGEIDVASTKYRQARAKWAEMSVPIDEAKSGLIGELSRRQDSTLRTAAERLLGPNSSPTTILQARALFERKAPGLWEDVLSVYLRQTWEKASVPIQSGTNPKAGANWAKTMTTAPMRRNLLAAMGAERYQAFSDLMDVLQATGKVQSGDSVTFFATEANKQIQREGAPVQKAAADFPFRLRQWWLETATDKYKGELARVMTDPQALAKLKELRRLDPRSQKALDIASDAVVNAIGAGGSAVLEPAPSDRLPRL